MLTKNDVAKVFDTVLSIPGMNEIVKIDLKISRKNVLLLNHIVDRGLHTKAESDETDLLHSVPAEGLDELSALAADCLHKAGLTELSEKLTTLHQKN
jgi:hypothetical protein